MITSFLYVSSSLLTPSNQNYEISDIISLAESRNAQLGVTGALIFTEARFAQVLEGRQEAVEELMASILQDRRHKDVQLVQVIKLKNRQFPAWSLAYSGPSFYVDRHIKALANNRINSEQRKALATKLISLMKEFTLAR